MEEASFGRGNGLSVLARQSGGRLNDDREADGPKISGLA